MGYSRFLLVLGTILLVTATVSAQTSTQPTSMSAKTPDRAAYSLPDIAAKDWTGDMDGMIKRRMIRVLVPYSKTFFFVDRGTQRGLIYEVFRIVEEDLNKKLKEKNIRVHVVFEPTARENLIPYLLSGRGDIAAGNLMITPERLKQVDFADPTRRNVSEIVVTGPGGRTDRDGARPFRQGGLRAQVFELI